MFYKDCKPFERSVELIVSNEPIQRREMTYKTWSIQDVALLIGKMFGDFLWCTYILLLANNLFYDKQHTDINDYIISEIRDHLKSMKFVNNIKTIETKKLLQLEHTQLHIQIHTYYYKPAR